MPNTQAITIHGILLIDLPWLRAIIVESSAVLFEDADLKVMMRGKERS